MKKKKDKQFRFGLIQQRIWNLENLKFWVFQKGKILPVAIIEVTPKRARLVFFSGQAEDIKNISLQFKKFSGCSI